jgi:hypothetical protein
MNFDCLQRDCGQLCDMLTISKYLTNATAKIRVYAIPAIYVQNFKFTKYFLCPVTSPQYSSVIPGDRSTSFKQNTKL